MPKSSYQKRKKASLLSRFATSAALHQRLIGVVAVMLFAGIGTYLVLATRAETAGGSTRNPKIYVEHSPDGTKNVVNHAEVGDMITPIVWEGFAGNPPSSPTNKLALIVSVYFIAERVTPVKVDCASHLSCSLVSWPEFSPHSNYSDRGSYNATYSVCIDLPTTAPTYRDLLFTPHFKVTKNNDSLPFSIVGQYDSAGGTSCAVNGGQGPQNNMSGGTWFQCYNRDGNQRPGNDGNGYPIACGQPGGGVPTRVGVEITGGNMKTEGPGNTGTQPKPNPGPGGGGGGSSANKQAEQPNTIPASTDQGDNTQPELNPSPFFDGKQYAAGSDPDSLGATAFSVGSRKIPYGWVYLLVAVLTATGGYIYWRWAQKHKKR